MLIVVGVLLLAATESMAPWTVQKSPLPSAATATLAGFAGPVDFVVNCQVVELAIPVK